MKLNLFLPFIGLMILGSCSTPDTNTSSSRVDQKIDSLLAEMTLYEKIGQMNQYSAGSNLTGPQGSQDGRYQKFISGGVGSVLNVLGAEETYKLQKLVLDSTRLKIPLIFAYDVIHGYKTIFPIPLAEAASWDMEAIQESARIAAKETAVSGVQWTFNPMLDVTRDARWGRVMEGAGEDPYLAAEIGAAKIKGYQGEDLTDEFTIAACAKHFAGYGFAESGKDYNTVLVGPYDLYNYILPPFKRAREEGVVTFMNGFNDLDGIPSTANKWLVDELLRKTWGFDGLVVSDWSSISELTYHAVAADSAQAAQLALEAGTDIDMEGEAYIQFLEGKVQSGEVSEELIDVAVRRILKLKFDLGLFDDPYRYMDTAREKEVILAKEHLDAALEAGKKSIVLLKNEGNLLPLKSSVRSIAVIGPLAKDKDAPIGNWRAQGESNSAISFFEGLEASLDNVTINYAEGCKLSIGPNMFHLPVVIEEEDRSGFGEAIAAAKKSEVVFMVLGEPAHMSGEARSRADIGLPGVQLELLQEVYKVNKNIVLVLMNGRPLTIPWEAQNIPTILETWFLGSMHGRAVAEVITGKYSPSGKLTMSFPRHVGQCPIYYNKRITGRPSSSLIFKEHHMDVDRSPQYPFGYGLSYTDFEISDPTISTEGRSVTVSVEVANVGSVSGKETVQVYVRDVAASIAPAIKELKGFAQVELESGQSKKISINLSEEAFSFYNHSGELVFEPGDFRILVGNSSANLKAKTINLK